MEYFYIWILIALIWPIVVFKFIFQRTVHENKKAFEKKIN